jgi:hypothetical protein
MDEEQVQHVKAELSHAVVERAEGLVPAVSTVGELGCDEDLLTWDP